MSDPEDTPRKPFSVFDEVPELVKASAAKNTPTGKYKALKKQFQWGGIVAGIALIGTIGGGVLAIINISRAEAQTAVAPTVEAQKLLDFKVAFLKEELARHLAEESEHRKRVEQKLDRQDINQQLTLDALGVAKWKRPPPMDGGE